MELELRLLRSFLAVADHGHVGRAAADVGLTQPALTRQIQTLESRVGVPLFLRVPRGVELTEAGRVLVQAARRLVADSERALARSQRAGRGELGHVAVGF